MKKFNKALSSGQNKVAKEDSEYKIVAEKNTFRNYTSVIYVTMVFIMLFIIVTIIVGRDKDRVSYGLQDFESVTDEWTDENGEVFQFSDIDKYSDPEDEFIWAYYEVGDVNFGNNSLFFRSKNIFVTVYEGDKEVYSTDLANHSFYSISPGTRWNLITISPDTKVIKLKMKLAYDDGRCKVDNFYIGDRGRIIIETIREKLFGILISFLILIVGIIFILADIVLNWWSKFKDHGLLYLGLTAVIASLWCLIETNILQLFCADLRILQVINNMLLAIVSMPMLLYLDYTFSIFHKIGVRIICIIDLAYIILSTVFHVFGIWDYHQTANIGNYNFAVVSVLVIFCTVIAYIKGREEKNFNYMAQLAGIAAIGLGVAGDLYRYLTSDVMDRAVVIRLGFLIFILCFGVGNMWNLIQLVEQGIQVEFISKLAYMDGLTNVRNRTAYIERLDDIIEKSNKKIGIIMLDINNLKSVNDTLGHGAGDEMIKVCARIIRNSFGKAGEVFRIGGDEFVVLILHDNPMSLYKKMLTVFQKMMEDEDSSGKYEFRVSIAHGISVWEENSKEDLENALKLADENMYKNKKYMKSAMLKEECEGESENGRGVT